VYHSGCHVTANKHPLQEITFFFRDMSLCLLRLFASPRMNACKQSENNYNDRHCTVFFNLFNHTDIFISTVPLHILHILISLFGRCYSDLDRLLERIWKETVVASSRYLKVICLQGLRKTTKIRLVGDLADSHTALYHEDESTIPIHHFTM
jgi:hypothetical protein